MKKQTRFTLLFVLAVALLLGVFAIVPFAAFADGEYTLTVYAVDRDGQPITNYGEISPAGVAGDASAISYSAEPGTDITLTVIPNENYKFVAWTDDPKNGEDLGKELSITLSSNIVRYAVFEPQEYAIYYVGAKNEATPPEAVQAYYGTDLELHPEYSKTMNLKSNRKYGEAVTVSAVTAKNENGDLTHTFNSWKAYNAAGDEVTLDIDDTTTTIKATTNCDVYLVPQWTPKTVTVTRIDRIGTPENYKESPLDTYTETFNYGKQVSGKDFGNKTYDGYSFDEADATKYTEIFVGLDADANIVYCYYTPLTFEITFDNNTPAGRDAITTPDKLTVTYNEATPSITPPVCEGYFFLGYYDGDDALCIDKNGNATKKIATWTILNDITLQAKWELQTHTVTVNVADGDGNNLENAVEILINGGENPGALDYGTEVTVQISVLPGQNKKLTMWRGNSIVHTTSYTETFTIGEEEIVIPVQALPVQEFPALLVDYAKEVLGGILPGNYQLTAGEGVQTVAVAEGEAFSVSGLLGKTVQIVRLGEDGVTADSDAQIIAISARPAAVEFEYSIVKETARERELRVQVPGGEGLYEVAWTTSETEVPTNWSSNLLLTGLEPGVEYFIHLRVRATDTAPHGVEATPQTVEFAHLVNLNPLLILLILMLVLQLSAIAFLIIGHRRATTNAVAAPLAAWLAVKLIPAGSFPWVIVLAIAVIAAQAVLVVLAVQSGVVLKKNKKEKSEGKDGAQPSDKEFTLFGEQTNPAPKTEQNKDGEDD